MKLCRPLLIGLVASLVQLQVAHAAVVVANNDSVDIPVGGLVEVEAPGVLQNDTLDGSGVGGSGVTAELLTPPSQGNLSCPSNSALQLCADGSFIYTTAAGFSGIDSFQYEAVAPTGERAGATVTLGACEAGATVTTCWMESAFIERINTLGYNSFREGFEGLVWSGVRSSSGNINTAPSVTSRGILWTTNFPGTNEITTGNGAARSGEWAAYDRQHGSATGTPIQCDVDTPPSTCNPLDGLTGTGTNLYAVGAYISGIGAGANISILLDGGVAHNIDRLTSPVHQFMGIIDTSGFGSFEFRETDGKIGQEFPVFFDDVIIATTDASPANVAPLLAAIGDRSVNENQQLVINLSASDANDGDSVGFSVSNLPPGAVFSDNGDGTATFSWTPGYDHAGAYTPTFTVVDNGIPSMQDTETISITVFDVNRAPLLTAIGNRSIERDSLLAFGIDAIDPDGHTIGFEIRSYPGGGSPPAGMSLTDNGNGSAQFSWTPTASQVGVHTIEFIASDNGTPSASDTEIVSITVTSGDAIAPVVTPPSNILVAATNATGTSAGVAAITVFLGGASATDDVDGAITTIVNDAPAVFPLGVTLVTFSATDSAGNTGSATATVTISDLTAPTLLLSGGSVTLGLGEAYVEPGFSASDNVDGDLTGQVVIGGNLNTTAAGSYSVTYDVTDAAGNSASQQVRSVTVQDIGAPAVTAPADIVVAATDASGTSASVATIAAFLGGASAVDDVDGAITTIVNDAPAVFPLGVTLVTFSATDSAGNTGSATATVTISDQTAPVIVLNGPGSVQIEIGSPYTDAGATASDNVDGDLGTSIVISSNVDTGAVGNYTVSFDVSDAAGNAASTVVRNVSVTPDVTPPVITLLGAATVNVEIGTLYVDDGASAFDNLDGAVAVVTANPVNSNIGGTYIVTYDATDSAGNAAQQVTRTVIVSEDTVAPVITLLGEDPVVLTQGTSYVDAGATAFDNVDGDLTDLISIVSTVDTSKPGSYTVIYDVSDNSGNMAPTVVRTVSVVADGSAPPLVIAPPDIAIQSSGVLTRVELGTAVVVDDRDVHLIAFPSTRGPFVPGRHQITWEVKDSSRNTGLALQLVDVIPLVEFLPSQQAEAGQVVRIGVQLNGEAVTYPVVVDYEIFEPGSQVPDGSGQIEISSGLEGSFCYTVPNGPRGAPIEVRIGAASNAVPGPVSKHLIHRIDTNVEPLVDLRVIQGGRPTRTIFADGGPVTIEALVRDANHSNMHSYDWSATDNSLLTSIPAPRESQIVIAPAGLLPGFYTIGVQVMDNGFPNLSSDARLLVEVLASAPVLGDNDSDGDGIIDSDEGIGDQDDDGLPDYLDAFVNPAILAADPSDNGAFLLETEKGITLGLGPAAQFNRGAGEINLQQLEKYLLSLSGVPPADWHDSFANSGGYFDFRLSGLPMPGQSVRVVIPQRAEIPATAVYRKYTVISGWVGFVSDAFNQVSSAPGEAGICPAPGATEYVAGLHQGYYCVQLLIEDGGPNDADGLRNGVILDPGGVGSQTQPGDVSSATTSTSGGGGGGSTGLWLLWFSLPLLRKRLELLRRRLL